MNSVNDFYKKNLKFQKFNRKINMPSVTMITNKEEATKAVEILMVHKNRFHAWDTETTGINPKEESPVGNGKIICLSCFIGPDVDFGNGPRLFIDNYDEDLVQVFKSYFENEKIFKVWHNYGFDRHILYNHGINVKGFGGDTMHMARMFDTSGLPGSFSLEKLTSTYSKDIIEIRDKYLDFFIKRINEDNSINEIQKKKKMHLIEIYKNFNGGSIKKIDMKTLFSKKKILKNGLEGKTMIMPEIEDLHTQEEYFSDWVKYSVLDTECTFYLRDTFQKYLQSLTTSSLSHFNPISSYIKNNYEYYLKYLREFGELLTDMEREGIKIDIQYLQKIQAQAETDLKLYENEFLDWVYSISPELYGLNAGSSQQVSQLLFAPCYKNAVGRNKEKYSNKRVLDNEEIEELEELEDFKVKTSSNKKKNMVEVLPITRSFKIDNTDLVPNEKGRILKKRELTITGLGLTPLSFTEKGVPQIDNITVKAMLKLEKNGKYLLLYFYL